MSYNKHFSQVTEAEAEVITRKSNPAYKASKMSNEVLMESFLNEIYHYVANINATKETFLAYKKEILKRLNSK